jgi:hypothetical protein
VLRHFLAERNSRSGPNSRQNGTFLKGKNDVKIGRKKT